MVAVPATSAQAGARPSTESHGQQVDAAHSGYVYGAGVLPPLSQAWSRNLGANAEQQVAIDGGHVFALESQNDPQTNDSQYVLVSIDLLTGQVSWSQPIGPVGLSANASVTVDNGRVYVGAIMEYDGTDHSVDGGYVLSAWDERTGSPLWSDTLMQHDPGTFIPPVVAAGVLYAQDGLDAYAIDESTGSYIWSTSLTANPAQMLDVADNSLTVAGSVVFIGASGCGTEEGLSAVTGAILWSENTNACYGGLVELASAHGGDVWAPGLPQGRLPAAIYDPSSGAILGGFPTGTPAFGYGEAVGLQTTPDGYAGGPAIEAFDPTSRSVLWSVPLRTGAPPDESGAASLPLLADGFVFEATTPAYPVNTTAPPQVEALDPCTGRQVWDAALPFAANEGAAELAAGDGYLLISSPNGELVAFKGAGAPAPEPPSCSGSATPVTGSAPQPEPGPVTAAAGPGFTELGATVTPSITATASRKPASQAQTLMRVRAALRRGLAAQRRSIQTAHPRAYRYEASFRSPTAGTLRIRWTVPVAHRWAGSGAHRSVTIGYAAIRLSRSRNIRIVLPLTRYGRRLLGTHRQLRIRTTWTFIPVGVSPTSIACTVTARP